MNAAIHSLYFLHFPLQTNHEVIDSDDDDDLIDDSLNNYNNAMETNNSSTIPHSQKHHDTPSSWDDKGQPNNDFHIAKQKYDKAMIELAILNCDYNSETQQHFQITISFRNQYIP